MLDVNLFDVYIDAVKSSKMPRFLAFSIYNSTASFRFSRAFCGVSPALESLRLKWILFAQHVIDLIKYEGIFLSYLKYIFIRRK